MAIILNFRGQCITQDLTHLAAELMETEREILFHIRLFNVVGASVILLCGGDVMCAQHTKIISRIYLAIRIREE